MDPVPRVREPTLYKALAGYGTKELPRLVQEVQKRNQYDNQSREPQRQIEICFYGSLFVSIISFLDLLACNGNADYRQQAYRFNSGRRAGQPSPKKQNPGGWLHA